MKKIVNAFKKLWHELVVIMTGKDTDLVDAGVLDFSGEGRDKYGK